MSKTALITGISGQDGAYLAQLLLDKGYRVVGTTRKRDASTTARLDELGTTGDVEIIEVDLLSPADIQAALEEVVADELYNLAGQSQVGPSFQQPVYTVEANALGATRILEAVRTVTPATRFYQASSSEMFGGGSMSSVNERDPFHPRSPYAASKLLAHCLTVNYRESYGLFAVSGLLFNHESPLRSAAFVTRKITCGIARIKCGTGTAFSLGNVDARRDWGFAGDYVEGMWKMLQLPDPTDFLLATGRSASVRDFVEMAARQVGFELVWIEKDGALRGQDRRSGISLVSVDHALQRPSDINCIVGDASKARRELGWQSKTSLEDLIAMMVDADMRRIRGGAS